MCSNCAIANDTANMVINDGRTTPSVANRAPKKPSILLPINVAAFTAMGPGVDSAIAIISSKSSFVAHCFLSTISRCISGIIAYPPPKVKAPILKNVANKPKAFFFTNSPSVF